MSKTYTFPALQTLSGQVYVYITTSTGSGNETLTDKYFSEEINITNETESLAGDLRLSSGEFAIAYDKNDLFRATILPTALLEDGYVLVRVTLNNNPIFYGRIEPSTITYDPFYADSDNLDGQKIAIRFRCNSLIKLLQSITKEDFVIALKTYALTQSKYVLSVTIQEEPLENVSNYHFYVTIRDIIDTAISMLGSAYTLSYTVNFALPDWTFYSKAGFRANGDYIYPAFTERGDINYSKFGGLAEPSLYLANTIVNSSFVVTEGEMTSGGLFADTDESFLTAYDYFIGILKSFGLYCDIQHSPYVNLIVTIGTRSSGVVVGNSDVLEVGELPMVEIGRKKINVTSHQSGNSYVKDFPDFGISEFSQECAYDFGNDLDFPGLGDPNIPANTEKSLMMKGGSYFFELVRYMGIGDGYLLNPSLANSIGSWTAGGTWAYDAGSPFTFGAARCSVTTNVYEEIYQVLTDPIYDGVIFGGQFRMNSFFARPIIKITFYSGTDVIKAEEFTFEDPDLNIIWYSVVESPARRNGNASPITKVSVSVKSFYVVAPAGAYLWFGYSFLQRARKGTPQLVGLQIEDLFNDANLSREQRTLNGIQTMKPSDYYDDNGERFYYKKVKWKLREYETEIEAINYPY